MIEIAAVFKGDTLVSLSAAGHSGSAPHGEDIVCAAVSTLMQALYVGMTEVLGLTDREFTSRIDSKTAEMSFIWTTGDERAQALAETVYLSLQGVAASHPEFVKIVRGK